MLRELLVVLGATSVTVVVHAVATFAVITHLVRALRRPEAAPPLQSLLLILRVVVALLVLHWIEAGIWAVVYLGAGAFVDIETAMYFSLTSYTTLGYGDVVLPQEWRLMGPFEAAVGILMFGWSTGVMVATISRIVALRLQLGEEESSLDASTRS